MVPARDQPRDSAEQRRALSPARRGARGQPAVDASHAPSATWAARERIVGVDRLLDRVANNADMLVQLAPGTLEADLWCLQTGGLQASGGSLNLAVRAAGRTLKDLATMTIRLECPGGAMMNGRVLETGSVVVWRPGTSYDGISPDGERWVTLLVPWDEILGRRAAQGGEGPPRWRSSILGATLLREETVEVRALADQTQALSSGGRVSVGPAVAAGLRAAWRGVAVRLFARAVPMPPPAPGIWNATLDVRNAERFMRTRLASPLYLAEVCRGIGARPRTLQLSFRRILRCTPMAYLQTLRLHASLRTLRGTRDEPPATVAEAARRCGITHLSRFGGLFRKRFGSSPQEVLQGARARERETGSTQGRKSASPSVGERTAGRTLRACEEIEDRAVVDPDAGWMRS